MESGLRQAESRSRLIGILGTEQAERHRDPENRDKPIRCGCKPHLPAPIISLSRFIGGIAAQRGEAETQLVSIANPKIENQKPKNSVT